MDPSVSGPSLTRPRGGCRPRRAGVRGFTLIELMVVMALVAIAAGVMSLAVRDPSATQLEHEAARLSALLESARTEARGSGLAVYWEPRGSESSGQDFRFLGLPSDSTLPVRWLQPGVSASVIGSRAIVLGPEAVIGAQRITLALDDRRLTLATDGIGPFIVSEQ